MKRFSYNKAFLIAMAASAFQFAVNAQDNAQLAKMQEENAKFYQQREMTAKPEMKAQLQSLRELITADKYTFQIGYTTAMNYTIEQITGLVEPADLNERIMKQNSAMEKMLDKKMTVSLGGCSTNTASFDWRTKNGTTPVRDQKGCGSCWAFSTVGAFEGSYRLTNSVAINSSEQQLLDCNPWGYSCSGGWWAHQYLIDTGVGTETAYPYTAVKAACKTAVARCYHATTWGYVGTSSGVPSVASVKQALCQHGPLSIAVLVTPMFQAYTSGVLNESSNPWTASTARAVGTLVKPTPAAGKIYRCIVAGTTGATQPTWPVSGTVTDGTVTWQCLGTVNHGVTLLGWNDSKNAWLIKNSWGNAWGETCGFGTEKGYIWIAYNCDNVGYAASWVQAKTEAPGCGCN
jgi:C1A family cysteine protease